MAETMSFYISSAFSHGFSFEKNLWRNVFEQLYKANASMATRARKLYLILGSLKSLPTIILLEVDSEVTAHALLYAYIC